MNSKKIILFGTGYMGLEYAKVLKFLKKDFIVVGRSQQSVDAFRQKTGIIPIPGGAEKFINLLADTSYKAIVAVSGDQIGKVTLSLIKKGLKNILVEKPAGLNYEEIKQVRQTAQKYSANVYVAYNRRLYASTIKALEIIKKDGGILSFHFEFNEPGYKLDLLESSKEIKKQWLLHNSTHVIDLAFFMGGTPKSINTYSETGTIFIGFGISKKNIPFSYHANWLSPGRWGLEFMTKNYRLIFRPMEKLHIQKKGSFEILNVAINDNLDTKFKPGLVREIKSFLGNNESLCTIEEQSENIDWYSKISNSK